MKYRKTDILIRTVRIAFGEERVDEFFENFQNYCHPVRNFEGCHHLELWQDVQAKNIFTTYSIRIDEAILNQYHDSELFKSA